MARKKKHSKKGNRKNANPLYAMQQAFLKALSDKERNEFFSPELDSERRAELWMKQADLGEELVNRYAWATPSPNALMIIKEFGPIVEIGCGANAYWATCMKEEGIDVVAYDMHVDEGGKIKNKIVKDNTRAQLKHSCHTRQGGPSMLEKHSDRTLFLCYPDEEDEGMGAECLSHYTGSFVVHVGECILDSNWSMEQTPWGRSSSSDFQQRLASEFHCILKVELPNWLHVRDTISVWKRSAKSTIIFAADSEEEDDEDEEIEYRHIPVNERLPMNLAAPCCTHLLPQKLSKGEKRQSVELKEATTSRSLANSADSSSSHKHQGSINSPSSSKPRSIVTVSAEKQKKENPGGKTMMNQSNSSDIDSMKKKHKMKIERGDEAGSRKRCDSTDSVKKRKKAKKS